jgi:hypothetical protein
VNYFYQKRIRALEGYVILAGYPTREEVDVKTLSDEYANSYRQLGSWYGSLLNTDYWYRDLRENGYGEDQIADWVLREVPDKEPLTPKNPPPPPDETKTQTQIPESIGMRPKHRPRHRYRHRILPEIRKHSLVRVA